MSDIVEQIKSALLVEQGSSFPYSLVSEAADLITSLRDQLAKAEAEREDARRKMNAAIGLRVQAESRATRSEAMCTDLVMALEKIVYINTTGYGRTALANIAREALASYRSGGSDAV